MGKINLIKVISTISALGIIGGGAVFLTLLTSCSNAQSVFINKDTATENYENLYVFNSNTKIPLLHTNVINLQTLSKKNHDSKKFIINSEIIDTPIYIPYGFTNFDLSCSATGRLVSSNSERVASKINIGIVFGSKVENYNNTYSLNANIHNMFIQISNDPGVGTFGIFGIFPQDEQNSHLYLQNNLILASESSDDKAIDIENIYFLTIRNNLFSSNGDGTSTIEISGNKTVEIFDNYINSASSTGLAIFMRTLRNNATFNLKNNFISSVQTPWVLGSAIQLMNLNKCDYILENNSFSVFNSMHQYVSTFTDFIIQTNSPEKDWFIGSNNIGLINNPINEAYSPYLWEVCTPPIGTFTQTGDNDSKEVAYHDSIYDAWCQLLYYDDNRTTVVSILNLLKNEIINNFASNVINDLLDQVQ